MRLNSSLLWMLLLAGALSLPPALARDARSDDIVLGQTSALTGILAEQGIANTTSSKAYFDYINAHGGINGRKIRLMTLDDGYDTARAVANARQLIEQEKAIALFGLVGIPANVALMPLIAKTGIPNFAPYTGSEMLRVPHDRLVFHVRASYRDEIDKIVEHLGVRGMKEIGVVYQNNAFGKETFASLVQALTARKLPLKISMSASINNDSSDLDKAVGTLAAARPKTIFLLTVGRPSVDFIKTYSRSVQGTQFVALSVMASQAAIDALGRDGIGIIVAQVSPFPFSATSGLVQEYQTVMQKMGIKERSYPSMEGFVNAKVMVEALRRCGQQVTSERLIDALESMHNVDLDGYMINFSKTSHQGGRLVDLTVISKEGRFLR